MKFDFRSLFILLFAVPVFADFNCDDAFKQQYVKGSISGKTADKIFNFKRIREDLNREIDTAGDEDRLLCLKDFYQDSMKQSGEYWGKRVTEDSCGEKCQAEAERSRTYLTNLDKEVKSGVRARLVQAKREKNICDTRAPATAQALVDTKSQLCCGTKSDIAGVVRGVFPELTYDACVVKTQPNSMSNATAAAVGTGSCAYGFAKEALKSLYEGIKAVFNLPFEIFAAASEIKALLTDPNAYDAFADKIFGDLTKYVEDRNASLTSCLNDYEKIQLRCEIVGSAIGTIFTPGSIVKIFKIAKMALGPASKAMGELLSQSAKGQKVLEKVETMSAKANSAMSTFGEAKKAVKLAAVSGLSKTGKAFSSLTKFGASENPFVSAFKSAKEKFGGAKSAPSQDGSIKGESKFQFATAQSKLPSEALVKVNGVFVAEASPKTLENFLTKIRSNAPAVSEPPALSVSQSLTAVETVTGTPVTATQQIALRQAGELIQAGGQTVEATSSAREKILLNSGFTAEQTKRILDNYLPRAWAAAKYGNTRVWTIHERNSASEDETEK